MHENHFTQSTDNESKSIEINATIIDSKEINSTINFGNILLPNVSELVEKLEKNSSNTMRNIDHSKIQSDTKDILYNSGDNILQLKKMGSATMTTTTAVPMRTTLSKTFSNSGGNGGTLDDVQTLTADVAVRKRHRRRRQGR